MAQKIMFLTPIDHIKTRPGMYCDTGSPKTLLRELVDNATDEALNSHATRIEIEYDTKASKYTVRDNGRGLPLYKVKEFKNQIAARLLLTELFSGGKFSHANYKYSAGTHGVGLTVVNALSSRTSVSVNSREANKFYSLVLENGVAKREDMDEYEEETWWTTEVTFTPNADHFRSLKTTVDPLSLELTKQLFPNCQITINGEEVKTFNFQKTIGEKLLGDFVFRTTVEEGTAKFDVYFGWSATEFNQVSKGTVNLVPCHVGWHEKTAKYKIGHALADLSDHVKPGEATYGLRLFVSTFTQEPTFASQTKERLSWMADVPDGFEDKLQKAIRKELAKSENEAAVQAVVRKIVAYKKRLEVLSDQDYINSVVRKGDDKRKRFGAGVGIWDCSCSDRTRGELYIVEGRSAAGHIRKTRNPITQAVLPLRGKPLNAVVKDDIKSILENKEMEIMVNTIGAGAFQTIDLSVMRYGKIIIASDADADGAQISNLILGALIYIVPEIVEAGNVYEVIAPLYVQNGSYFYSLEGVKTNKPFERFKGLGSMNPDEVERTIVNPNTRKLRQITLDDRPAILEIMQLSSVKKSIMVKGGVVVEKG